MRLEQAIKILEVVLEYWNTTVVVAGRGGGKTAASDIRQAVSIAVGCMKVQQKRLQDVLDGKECIEKDRCLSIWYKLRDELWNLQYSDPNDAIYITETVNKYIKEVEDYCSAEQPVYFEDDHAESGLIEED